MITGGTSFIDTYLTNLILKERLKSLWVMNHKAYIEAL